MYKEWGGDSQSWGFTQHPPCRLGLGDRQYAALCACPPPPQTGDVLSALSSENKDLWLVPYRNSKLTHLLRYAYTAYASFWRMFLGLSWWCVCVCVGRGCR